LAHELGRLPVLGLLEVGVGGQGRVPVGVAGAAGDGAPVHPAGDQLGDHEVAQVMQAATPAEAAGEALEAVGDAVGVDRPGAVGTWENT
jgi:hypothetical protein